MKECGHLTSDGGKCSVCEERDTLRRLLHVQELKVDALTRTVNELKQVAYSDLSLGLRMVRDWMYRAGQQSPEQFQFMDEETARLRARLILEECMETMEAFGARLILEDESPYPDDVHLWKIDLPPNEEHYVKLLDGLCDMLYVIYGTFVAMGLSDMPFFREVHRSNVTKLEGLSHREDGKVAKSEAYEPPDLHRILLEQS